MSPRCFVFLPMSFCLIFFCVLFDPNTLFSHPHIFVEPAVTAVFDKEGLAGIREKWIFDEMFSQPVIKDCDKNRDGKFNEKEKAKAIKQNFFRLGAYNYFSQIEVNGKDIIIKFVEDADIAIEENNILFSFFVPLNLKATDKFTQVTISIMDIEYYCDFLPVTEYEFSMRNTEPFRILTEFTQNMTKAYYFGLINPHEARIRFKKK